MPRSIDYDSVVKDARRNRSMSLNDLDLRRVLGEVNAAVQRVLAALEEMGEGATVRAIARRAGVPWELVDWIVTILDDRQREEAGDWSRTQRGEELGVDPESGLPLHLARPGEPVDQLQRPLAGEMIAVFADLPAMRSLIRQLDVVAAQIERIGARPSGAWLDPAALAAAASAREQLRQACPYCVCPSCGGVRRTNDYQAHACPTCTGVRFIAEGYFPLLNADLRDVANGYRT
jgi:hypothetical protein